MIDSRDSQTYKTVVIGTQTWMAQNLNYEPSIGNSWCYHDTASYCSIYGRLYDYATAMTACPTGWHLPDTTEWNTLETNLGGTATAGGALLSATGWVTGGIKATNPYGFSALPGGYYDPYNNTTFLDVGSYAAWWTATPGSSASGDSYDRSMNNTFANLTHNGLFHADGLSVRCLLDMP